MIIKLSSILSLGVGQKSDTNFGSVDFTIQFDPVDNRLRTATFFDSGGDMTTSEITLALEDIAIVNLNDIVDVMLYLGYSIVTNEIKGPEWGMTAKKN